MLLGFCITLLVRPKYQATLLTLSTHPLAPLLPLISIYRADTFYLISRMSQVHIPAMNAYQLTNRHAVLAP